MKMQYNKVNEVWRGENGTVYFKRDFGRVILYIHFGTKLKTDFTKPDTAGKNNLGYWKIQSKLCGYSDLGKFDWISF